MLEMLKLNSTVKGDTTVSGLLDAVFSYELMPALKISAGQFKTPFSMAYNTSRVRLDTIGFGMAANVSLGRSVGLMVSGRHVADSGLGYDVGVFKADTRATGTSFTTSTRAHDDMVSGRVLFDGFNKALHLEAGSARAGVTGGSPYVAGYAALRLRYKPLEMKAEYLQGMQGARETAVIYGQLLVTVLKHYELVGKWERTRFSNTGVALTADNLTFGLNAALYPETPRKARLQLNYVLASRDAARLGSLVGFKKGHTDNQVRLLLQAGF